MYRLFFAAALLCCGTLLAQTGEKAAPPPKEPAAIPPQVDTAEVLRRGDMVVIAGEGPRGADEDAMRMATAPPPDESSMWFVTVIKTNGCPYCTKLHSDFQAAPELLAFVAATPPYKPWGHYNEYNVNDETQKWRIKAYRISGYPTLVIQPPRNGMWGNPRTVVFQTTGYDGNPKKLAASITSGVRKYAAKMSEQGYPKIQATDPSIKSQEDSTGGPQQRIATPPISGKLHGYHPPTTPMWGNLATGPKLSEAPARSYPVVVGGAKQFTPEPSAPTLSDHLDQPAGRGQFTPANTQPYGTNPPFNPPPKVDPFNPQPLSPNQPGPQIDPNWPPTTPTTPPNPNGVTVGMLVSLLLQALGSFLGGSGLTNLLLLVVAGIYVLSIVAPITKTKLDDEALVILQQIRDRLGGSPTNPPSPPTTTQV